MLRLLALSVSALVLCSACKTVGWDGEVQRFGSMREVMMGGQTQGRVRVVEVGRGPETVAIGSLAGLHGEVSVVDGAVWISRVEDGLVRTTQGATSADEATMFVGASVSDWVEIPIDHEIDIAELAAWTGFAQRDWPMAPFIVRGRLVALDAHILNGACPEGGAVPPGSEPVRKHEAQVFGTLVGFWARDGAGVITHAGQALHTHVVVRADPSYTAHVDRVRIGAGSSLFVPRDFQRMNKGSPISRTY